MASTIVTKNSVTAASAPTISDIIQGELATNLTDGLIFSRDEANNIVSFGVIKAGASNTNTARFDGTDWITSAVLQNDGTDITITNDLNVGVDLDVTGNALVGGTLGVTGAVTAASFSGDGSAVTAVDAATLDALDSTQFLRSDTADTKTSGSLSFNDNIDLVFGNSDRLVIDYNSVLGTMVFALNAAGLTFTDDIVGDLATLDTGGFDLLYGTLQVDSVDLTDGFKTFKTLTQAAYDALTPSADIVYLING